MSIADKLATVAENMPKVYQAGYDKGAMPLYFGRVDGNFQYFWGSAEFPEGTDLVVHHPKITNINFAFQHMKGVRSITIISDDTSGIIAAAAAFNSSKTVEFIDLTRCSRKFQNFGVEGANALKSIYGVLDFSEVTNLTNAFRYLYALEDIELEPNCLNLSIEIWWSTNLTKASITSIINGLSDTTSGLTLTLSKTAVDNAFEDAEWSELEATKPNWTISLV